VKEWRVILAALVIFGAGVVTGALVVNLSRKPLRPQNVFVGPLPGPGVPANVRPPWHDQRYEFVRRAERQLDLTPEQRQRIDGLVRDSQQRTKTLWEGFSPKLVEEMRKVREQVRDVLTPEQRKRFDELSAKPRLQSPEEKLWKSERRDERRNLKQPASTLSSNLASPAPAPGPQ
jgi:hypothetical protein